MIRKIQLAFLLSLSVAMSGVVAAEPLSAKQHFELGLRSFDLGQFEESAQEFEAAYKLSGDPTLLFNVAQAYRQARNFAKALFFYKTYVANYARRGADVPNRGEVDQRIAEANQQLGTVALPTGPHPPPATVTTAKPDPPARKPWPSTEAPPAHTTGQVEPAHIEPIATQTTPARPVPRWVRWAGAAALGVGGAALVGGAVLSKLAADAGNQVGASSGEFTVPLRNEDRLGQHYDQGAIGLFVAGGVLVAAGAVAVGLSFRTSTGQSAALVPLLSPNTVGVATGGSF